MCVIIVKPENKTIDRETLYQCFDSNPDGAGFMYVNDSGNLITVKTMQGFRKFYKQYRSIKPDNKTVIIHFRIATHGAIDIDNCHPFYIDKTLAFCHNGMLNNIESTDKKSDTCMLNELILKKLPANFLHNTGIVDLLERFIGKTNKLAFLDNMSNYYIINEKAGTWRNEIWFSNTNWDWNSFNVYSQNKYQDWYAGVKNSTNPQYCIDCASVLTEEEIVTYGNYCFDCATKSYATKYIYKKGKSYEY